jgi:hypothetical protein
MWKFLSDTGFGIVVALIVAVVGWNLMGREKRERRQVVFRANPRVEYTPTTATVTVSLANTGNRPTAIRDIRLILDDGRTLASSRSPGHSNPALPVRLDAPAENDIRLDVPREDGHRIRRVEVDLLGDDEPREVVNWPTLELRPATVSASATVTGELKVTPAQRAQASGITMGQEGSE